LKLELSHIGQKGSFSEADDLDVEYYANITWKQSAKNVEEMRKQIWSKEYKIGMLKIKRISTLKADRDDFE
jgi:hypothetical protein